VVADAVIDASGRRVELPSAAPLVARLRARGIRVVTKPVVASDRVVTRAAEYERLARTGAAAVDMESAAVVAACSRHLPGVPIAVVRVVVDTPLAPMLRPHTVTGGITALRTLRRLGPVLADVPFTLPRGAVT
jgi:4-hydroxy-3-methylbut-2-enyl diphosphate reductase